VAREMATRRAGFVTDSILEAARSEAVAPPLSFNPSLAGHRRHKRPLSDLVAPLSASTGALAARPQASPSPPVVASMIVGFWPA
jgi:hypothetical protein